MMEKALNGKSKSVCIAFAAGCHRSEMSTAMLFAYFEANGWEIKEWFQDVDIVLVSTCGVDLRSEEHSMRLLSIVDKKRKADSTLVVCGCLAGINQSRIQKDFDVVTISPIEMGKLDEVINAKVKLQDVRDINYIDPYIDRARHSFGFFERYLRSTLESFGRGDSALIKRKVQEKIHKGSSRLEFSKGVFSIKVSYGCLEECSYCAIRFAEGSLRSKPLERILEEFDTGLNEGYENFRIIGTDVGAYGQDVGMNVADLSRKLFERENKFNLELSDLHPKWFIAYSKELIELFVENNQRIHLVIVPIQSGSESLLKLMKRDHTISEAQECLCELRKACPEIKLATHALVGFPSETDSDFEATIEFLKKVNFDRIDIYGYGDRPNTLASQMENKVSEETIKSRICRLREEFPQTWYQP
jgi:tRNA A37 methylthiotransferase MiaB